jgi:hypothetical protein
MGLLCLAAIALGVFADRGQLLPGSWAVVPELGTPWALLGFAGGRLWLNRWLAASFTGLGLVVLALWAYYLYVHLQYGTELYNAMNGSRGSYLTALAAAVGAASGLVGSLTGATRPLTRTLAWGFVVAVPTSEVWRARQYGDAGQELQALLAGTALCLLLWAGRRTAGWLPLVAGTLTWVGLGLAAMVALQAFPI